MSYVGPQGSVIFGNPGHIVPANRDENGIERATPEAFYNSWVTVAGLSTSSRGRFAQEKGCRIHLRRYVT